MNKKAGMGSAGIRKKKDYFGGKNGSLPEKRREIRRKRSRRRNKGRESLKGENSEDFLRRERGEHLSLI